MRLVFVSVQDTPSATVWCPSNLRIIKEELEGSGTLRHRKSWPIGARSRKRDDDPPDMRRLGGYLFICTGIRRNMCCFSLWLRRGPNRLGGADGSKRDDRSASRPTIWLSRHSDLTFNRAKRHRPDK